MFLMCPRPHLLFVVQLLLSNRAKVVYCTRLKQAQTAEERAAPVGEFAVRAFDASTRVFRSAS